MKIITSLAATLLTALTFTSCLSNNDNAKNEATFNSGGENCFNYVTDLDTDESYCIDGPSYKMVYNFTDGQVQIEMTNFKVSNDMTPVSLRLPEMALVPNVQAGLYETRQRSVVPLNAVQNNFVFDSFELYSAPERFISMGNNQIVGQPLYIFMYELNSRYRVTTFPVQISYLGASSATALKEDGTEDKTFKYNYNLFAVKINYKKSTASLNVVSGQFAEGMPTQALEIRDLPVVLNENGYSIVTDATTQYPVYSASGQLMEGCSASDFRGSSSLLTGLSGMTAFNFTIDLTGQKSTYFKYGKYKVFASLSYYGVNATE